MKKLTPKGYAPYDSIYITFLKWYKYRNGGQISGFQGLKKGRLGRWELCFSIKGHHRDPYDDGNVLYHDCIDINNLVVVLYYSFAR